MKFKNVVKVFLSCVLAGALFTGCGGQGGDVSSESKSESDSVKLGVISHLNATENKFGEIYNKFVEKAGLHAKKYDPKFYDTLNQMIMDAEAGNVEQLSLYQCVANYLIANNDKYEVVEGFKAANLSDSFCFAVRKDDTELKAELDKTINEMKADGTLDKLVKEYITDVKPDNVPKVEIPMTEGAKTVTVGVTGDLPPFDLVLADGTPAGFNTALLAEIGKRINCNIEIIAIESGARAAALSSNQIDVIFWAIVPENNDQIPADIDKPEGVEFSVPYFKDNVAHIKLKSDK